MDLKEVALLLSPAVAILVAIGTIWFNVLDRRRHYDLEREKLTLEREKISKQLAKDLLAGSKVLERRTELYNDLMQSISVVSALAQACQDLPHEKRSELWNEQAVIAATDALLKLIRANQALTTQFLHETITRFYVVHVATIARSISDELSNEVPSVHSATLTSNRLQQLVGHCDATKSKIRDDLEQFVRGLSSLSK